MRAFCDLERSQDQFKTQTRKNSIDCHPGVYVLLYCAHAAMYIRYLFLNSNFLNEQVTSLLSLSPSLYVYLHEPPRNRVHRDTTPNIHSHKNAQHSTHFLAAAAIIILQRTEIALPEPPSPSATLKQPCTYLHAHVAQLTYL